MNRMQLWSKRRGNGGEMESGRGEMEERAQMDPMMRPLMTLQEEMNRIFNDFFDVGPRSFGRESGTMGSMGSMGTMGRGGLMTRFEPRMDVSENEKEVKISLDIPGMSRDEIELSLSDDLLTISGERSETREEEKENYLHRERSYGMFRRTIPLPEYINRDKIDAKFKDGVLNVTLPKTDEGRKKWRRIDVK